MIQLVLMFDTSRHSAPLHLLTAFWLRSRALCKAWQEPGNVEHQQLEIFRQDHQRHVVVISFKVCMVQSNYLEDESDDLKECAQHNQVHLQTGCKFVGCQLMLASRHMWHAEQASRSSRFLQQHNSSLILLLSYYCSGSAHQKPAVDPLNTSQAAGWHRILDRILDSRYTAPRLPSSVPMVAAARPASLVGDQDCPNR